jgi:putative membrane-bound dehydrogenase-like protein
MHLAIILIVSTTLGQADLPKSPAEALACMRPRPGFKVELMAAEPLVMDPIAFAFGPDGKLWVVEMGDYPLGLDGKGKPGGRIKYLEKSKADGPYDTMTVFLDNLGFPTGVLPYGRGILVTCAPDIFYVAVGSDGKAKDKQVLFTGFREGNQQHRVNGLVWGIDNWIYGANGDSGGMVRSLKTGKTTDIRGRDFRLKAETGEFEAVSGQAQFGRCRDDWGNAFGNNNTNPMFHYVLDDSYLRRNPHVLYPDSRAPVSVQPGAAPVYPASKGLPRFNSPHALNHFTSACSTVVYRDTLFGKEFEGNMFVSEPVHNLVHREIMSPKGTTFTSRRADDEQTSEFLGSTDHWFRPAMIQTGPDGALWVADMYRMVIEHPEWIPKDWQKKLDLRAGHDRGRIYRVYPTDSAPRTVPRLASLSDNELWTSLESPSGWVRDTAQQLLVERYAKTPADPGLDPLRLAASRALRSDNPRARLHAAYVLASLGASSDAVRALRNDPHPALRKHALMLEGQGREDFVARCVDDPDPQVRLQAAYLLGDHQKTLPLLAKTICREDQDPYIIAAALSSISKENFREVFAAALTQPKISPAAFGPLLRIAGAYGEPLDVSRLLLAQIEAQRSLPVNVRLIHIADMIESMEKNQASLANIVKEIHPASSEEALRQLRALHASAVELIESPSAPAGDRFLAIRILSRGIAENAADRKRLVALLTPQTPDDYQSAALQQLRGDADSSVAGMILAPWKSYSPTLRSQALDAILSRPTWTATLLEALRSKTLAANEIDAVRRQRLLALKDPILRSEAETVLTSTANVDRGKVLADVRARLGNAPDPSRGGKIFAKACAVCHKLGDVGQNVGPDLASVGDKSVEGLLIAILDPSRAVESRYVSYLATTRSGLTLTGVIAAETSTSITLIGVDGKSHQLLRSEIDELSSNGKSLMPDGLERDLTPQDLGDVIAYIRARG